ncbi:MAG: flagellar hook-length control protein FliK [Myxococcales bacterium]|nr:flagellar hook-length control protein FliK [Myxococcales bacterium]
MPAPAVEENRGDAPIQERSTTDGSFQNALELTVQDAEVAPFPPQDLEPEENPVNGRSLGELGVEEGSAQEASAQDALFDELTSEEALEAENDSELPDEEILLAKAPRETRQAETDLRGRVDRETTRAAADAPSESERVPTELARAAADAPSENERVPTELARAAAGATSENERVPTELARAAAGAASENERVPTEFARAATAPVSPPVESKPTTSTPAPLLTPPAAERSDAVRTLEPPAPSPEGQAGSNGQSDARFASLTRAAAQMEAPELLGPRVDPALSSSGPTRLTEGVASELRALPELPIENEAEIMRQVRVLAQNGGGRAQIQLNPPELGGLSLRLTVMHDSVQLSVVAERGAVAELIARHLPELRQALEAQGLKIDHLEVDVREREEPGGSRARDWTEQGTNPGQSHAGSRGSNSAFTALDPIPSPLSTLHSLGAVDVHV